MADRFLIVAVVVAMLTALAVEAGHASFTVNGTVTPDDPTMPVVFITTPNCTGQGSAPVLYQAHHFRVDVPGIHLFTVSSTGGFASFYVYMDKFDPDDGFTNCIAADNSGNPTQVARHLDPADYALVVFDDTFDQLGGDYHATVAGPTTSTTTTTVATTTTTTLPGCVVETSLTSVDCRMAALATAVDASVPPGAVHDALAAGVAKARARVQQAATATPGKARRALGKARRALAKFVRRLNRARELGNDVRSALAAAANGIAADLTALRGG